MSLPHVARSTPVFLTVAGLLGLSIEGWDALLDLVSVGALVLAFVGGTLTVFVVIAAGKLRRR